MPQRAATVAVATPCWPAPVSAITRLAHAAGDHGLADAVVHQCAPVAGDPALEVDLRAAEEPDQRLGVVDRARAADVVFELVLNSATNAGSFWQAA